MEILLRKWEIEQACAEYINRMLSGSGNEVMLGNTDLLKSVDASGHDVFQVLAVVTKRDGRSHRT